MSTPRAFWGRPRAHAPRSVGKTLLANARADNLRRTLNYRNELHIVQTLRSAQPQPFVRRRPGERNRVFGPTGPSEYAAVRSQALLILAIPDHAPRAGQLGLAIRAMSCSAAPAPTPAPPPPPPPPPPAAPAPPAPPALMPAAGAANARPRTKIPLESA